MFDLRTLSTFAEPQGSGLVISPRPPTPAGRVLARCAAVPLALTEPEHVLCQLLVNIHVSKLFLYAPLLSQHESRMPCSHLVYGSRARSDYSEVNVRWPVCW